MKRKIDYGQLQKDHDSVIAEAKRINNEWHDMECANTHFRAMQARGVRINQTAMNRIRNGEQKHLPLEIAIEICKEYEMETCK